MCYVYIYRETPQLLFFFFIFFEVLASLGPILSSSLQFFSTHLEWVLMILSCTHTFFNFYWKLLPSLVPSDNVLPQYCFLCDHQLYLPSESGCSSQDTDSDLKYVQLYLFIFSINTHPSTLHYAGNCPLLSKAVQCLHCSDVQCLHLQMH